MIKQIAFRCLSLLFITGSSVVSVMEYSKHSDITNMVMCVVLYCKCFKQRSFKCLRITVVLLAIHKLLP